MLSTRQIILSQNEVCEAIRDFVRAKYHEKIEKGYELSNIKISEEEGAVNFTFSETLSPFVKSSHGKS
jgi:hypothetical protein